VEKLLEDKAVGFAAVDYVHPTRRTPLLKIKGKNCRKLVADALKELQAELKALGA
jgi:DNA-directed RNA polymerase subunit L